MQTTAMRPDRADPDNRAWLNSPWGDGLSKRCGDDWEQCVLGLAFATGHPICGGGAQANPPLLRQGNREDWESSMHHSLVLVAAAH